MQPPPPDPPQLQHEAQHQQHQHDCSKNSNFHRTAFQGASGRVKLLTCTLARSVKYTSALHSDAPSVCSLTADGFTSLCPHPPRPHSQRCCPCPERSIMPPTPMRNFTFGPVGEAQQGLNSSPESTPVGCLHHFQL